MTVSERRAPVLVPGDLARHGRPGPRYTSYPPATEFGTFGSADAAKQLRVLRDDQGDSPISLYCHVPFCSRLCWYCGCNVVITRKRDRGSEYVDTLCAEIALLGNTLGGSHPLSELSLGGGSPNFLKPEDLARIADAVRASFAVTDDAELGVELDPRDTDLADLTGLAGSGFRRLSVGVQDFDPEVQETINRIQTAEQTENLIADARRLGFNRVNIDLVYGLPGQTPDTFADTLGRVLAIDPHQIALFGYAHLPHRLKHQKLVERNGPVPAAMARAELLLTALDLFEKAGYVRIGLDHFAKPDSPLVNAALTGQLHRNFQGYVVKRASTLLACGSTGISDAGGAYWQNHTDIDTWAEMVLADELPVARGVALSDDDELRRHVITRLMCDLEIDFDTIGEQYGIDFRSYFDREITELEKPEYNALAEVDREAGWLSATELGCSLIRNVCMVFDSYLSSKPESERPRFSTTV